MPTPFPTQLSGAQFLANRKNALLADEPRVGKTGTAIIAADYCLDEKLLIVTTASGRPVWKRGLQDWSAFPRPVQILTEKNHLDPKIPSAIVGWGGLASPKVRAALLQRKWDRLILDESHWAKSFEAKRTQAAYGVLMHDGQALSASGGVAHTAAGVWCLSGTPLPNAPNDLYPMMRALCPHRLKASGDWPDVTRYDDFLKRYCITKPKKIGNWKWIQVVIGGRNLEELRERLGDFMLRRTQQDVGIRKPIYETLPLLVSKKERDAAILAEHDLDRRIVLNAAATGDTQALEMHLGKLRRLTGEVKARAVIEAVTEEFACGLDKIVLMAWHRETMQILKEGLARFGVVGIDGRSNHTQRTEAEERFLNDQNIRVFVGQIQAAGEAIDLSAAATLWFVETSFTPKDMKQAALRITNHTQTRQALVRVCVLEGSIDEALQTILLRKWTAIREVLAK